MAEEVKSGEDKEDVTITANLEDETSDASLLEMKIIRQCEYYFGNVNLWRDKFLKEKIKVSNHAMSG